MKQIAEKWWTIIFMVIPALYLLAQFLPYYHSGETDLPSLGSVFWFPAENQQTINFIGLFYHGFRVNELTGALLSTQLLALFLIVLSPILKSKGTVAALSAFWGAMGLITFFTTRSLTFSPVMVYGGIAGIIMLLLFAASIVLAALYFIPIYKEYQQNLALVREDEQRLASRV